VYSVVLISYLISIESIRIKLHIEPLAIAVNAAQQGNIRCDQVLVLLSQLRQIYVDIRIKDRTTPNASEEDDDHPVTAIIDSIEKRWKKADQDLFVACVFLNPFLKARLFNPEKLSIAMLLGILRRLYTRVFRVNESPAGLLQEIMKYNDGVGAYSNDLWPLEELKEVLHDAVRSYRWIFRIALTTLLGWLNRSNQALENNTKREPSC
jgi:hypothetical protein